MRDYSHFMLFLAAVLLMACGEKRQEPVTTPWGQVLDSVPVSEHFDLHEIQTNGELIVATVSGPQTYYDYRGRHLGLQYMLCERLANKLGVGLRIDLCRDSAEMVEKLSSGGVDVVAWDTPGKLEVSSDKPLLSKELKEWYSDSLLAAVRQEESFLLSTRSVKRHVFSPMLDKKGGVISHYDALFIQYCRPIRWDWRLMAAQCYQESTFDPKATSWAGAQGLMQIMPSTADHLGVPRDKLFDPESNIAAAAKYLGQLERQWTDITDRNERTNFILASYNGGIHHIRDAMALTKRDGGNPHRWREVSAYVLKLAEPRFYNDPLVKNGYMRGSETVDYVAKIRQRHQGYLGVKSPHVGFQPRHPRKAENRKRKYDV